MNDKEKFYQIINQFDFLKPLWKQGKGELRLEELECRMQAMSSGEQELAAFMVSVWCHGREYDFDIFSAMKTLSGQSLQIIKDWIAEPYWP